MKPYKLETVEMDITRCEAAAAEYDRQFAVDDNLYYRNSAKNHLVELKKIRAFLRGGLKVEWHQTGLLVKGFLIISRARNIYRIKGKADWYDYPTLQWLYDKYLKGR